LSQIKSERITLVDINKIVINPKNVNKHSKEQIKKLAELIEHNGFRDPLIVSLRSGFLIAGHGRLEAAVKLKMEKLPVIYQDFKSEAEEFQFMTAHNAISKWSSLDTELVLEGINEFNLDVDLMGIKNFRIPTMENQNEKETKDEQKFFIVVECKNETEQNNLFSELQTRGLECKLMS